MTQNGTSISIAEPQIYISNYADSDELFHSIVDQISDQNQTESQIFTSDYVDSDEQFYSIIDQISNQNQQPIKRTPTSSFFIRNLPTLTIKTRSQHSKTDSNDSICAICKDEFTAEDKINMLPCRHYFHVECIVPWMNLNTTCPLCRYKLPERKYRSVRKRRRTSWLRSWIDANRRPVIRRSSRLTRSTASRIERVIYGLRNRTVIH
ncbi:hypothetical protein LguiB_032247 [Lonicera macranthoides]